MRYFYLVLIILIYTQASLGQLIGSLNSGTLGPGVFTVVGNIQLNADSTLYLAPGTTLNFQGAYYFRVYGTLRAEGNEENQVVFTTNQSGTNRWKGIRLQNASSSGSRFAYCLVENGYATGSGLDADGGGICCYQNSSSFQRCTIRYCRARGMGGGVYVGYNGTHPTFTNCAFVSDTSGVTGYGGFGGGVEVQDSALFVDCRFDSSVSWGFGGGVDMTLLGTGYPHFTNCTFTANTGSSGAGAFSQGNSGFVNCTFSRNSTPSTGNYFGGGVNGSGIFTNCIINDNSAGSGGGVDVSYSTFTNCIISGNSTIYNGGGVYTGNSTFFTNCVISGNSALGSGGGVYCNSSSTIFNSTIISFSTGVGIYFIGSSESRFINCDIFGNSEGNFTFPGPNPINGPPGFGQLITTNANGDSCDIYKNIFLNPMFMDTSSHDFHLMDISHCIGASDTTDTVSTDFEGNPRPNPAGSNPDLGAFENPNAFPVVPSVNDLVISMQGGNAVLNWSTAGGVSTNVYGTAIPFTSGDLLATVTGTSWTDNQTQSRPPLYFYYVTAGTVNNR